MILNRFFLILGLAGVAAVGLVVLLLGSVIDEVSTGLGAVMLGLVALFFAVLIGLTGRATRR